MARGCTSAGPSKRSPHRAEVHYDLEADCPEAEQHAGLHQPLLAFSGLEPEEKFRSGKNTWGEIRRKEKKKDQSAEVSRRRSLYSSLGENSHVGLAKLLVELFCPFVI